MAFSKRLINFQFSSTSGGFNGLISGLRSSVHIEYNGTESLAQANVRIWGMPLSQMNQISTLGRVANFQQGNSLTISASSAETGLSTTFKGIITDAWSDFQGAADVVMHILCTTGQFSANQNVKPQSFNQSSVQASQLFNQLASQLNLTLENNGVNATLRYPYLWGSALNQLKQVIQAANCYWIIENDTLAVWPRNGSRSGGVVTIAPPPQGGMVGYPTSGGNGGVRVRTIFDPTILAGKNIQIISSVTPATGKSWRVYKLEHDLESLKPHGMWFTTVYADLPQANSNAQSIAH